MGVVVKQPARDSAAFPRLAMSTLRVYLARALWVLLTGPVQKGVHKKLAFP